MNPETQIQVFYPDGHLGYIDKNEQSTSGSQTEIRITTDQGEHLLVPWDMLQFKEDGSAYIPIVPKLLPQTGETTELVLPVIEEDLVVGKMPVETGKVRLHKKVSEREETIDASGYREKVSVERVPMDQALDAPAKVRQEGDTTIIPVMEEILVIGKRLVLKEEIRITKQREEVRGPGRVTLRSEEIDVERLDGAPDQGERSMTTGEDKKVTNPSIGKQRRRKKNI